MAEKKTEAEQEVRAHVVELGKPYLFEGQEYTEIDLGGLERLTVRDLVRVQLRLFEQQEMASMFICETTTAFAREVAAAASGLPVEFFKYLPRGAMRKVRQEVTGLLNVDNAVENHVMKLEKPYHFEGKAYTEIDLGGITELNSMNESAAENRIAREGFVVTETSGNYLFACVIAAMGTGLPEEFFTGLPMKEAAKLKNAVNDSGFFE